jgi:LPXTG-site transpeptidase (sortase) family protein
VIEPITDSTETQSDKTVVAAEPSMPVHINVSSVNVSLDIEPGYYDYTSNTWTLSQTKANFATVTSVPNSVSGNTYIYGHNQSNIFANMANVNYGDIATVTNSVGTIFNYKLVDIKDVKPDDLSFLNYAGKPILTIQTCYGFWDQYRRLFIFDLESESQSV